MVGLNCSLNPVRYMGLLEIVKNENNDLEKINYLKGFCEIELGKGAIVCNFSIIL